MTLRFLHTADVHLDAPFASRSGEVRALLRRGLEESFIAAVDLALHEKLDAFLVCGDLFDNPRPSVHAEGFLLGQIERLAGAGISFFYATGNHDPIGGPAGGRRIEWPEGVTLFASATPARVEVRRARGRVRGAVTGAGHESAAVAENLASHFPVAPSGLPEIALLHTMLDGSAPAGEHERYAPCALADLRDKGYAYWALGHIHKRQAFGGEPPVHYPGSIAGLHRKETGAKGVLVVEASPALPPEVRFFPTSPFTWEEIDVEITGIESVTALRRRLAAALSGPSLGEGSLITLVLTGVSPLADDLGEGEALRELGEDLAAENDLAYLTIRAPALRRPIDRDEARAGPVGTMLDLVVALREGRESFDRIAPEPLAGLPAGEGAAREAYLLSLLEGAEEEIVRRMWREGR